AVVPLRGPELGVDVRAVSRRWPDQAAEQEPDRHPARVRAYPAVLSADHGAGEPGDGAEDAAGNQGTGAAPGGRGRPGCCGGPGPDVPRRRFGGPSVDCDWPERMLLVVCAITSARPS